MGLRAAGQALHGLGFEVKGFLLAARGCQWGQSIIYLAMFKSSGVSVRLEMPSAIGLPRAGADCLLQLQQVVSVSVQAFEPHRLQTPASLLRSQFTVR